MITGIKQPQRLNKQAILDKVSQADILQFYLKGAIPGKCMLSPFRQEATESFYISKEGDFYRDLGDSAYVGDAFRLVMQLFGLSFVEALNKINVDFGLGYEGAQVKDYQRIIKALPKHRPKPETRITTIRRDLLDKERIWWERHLQSPEDLLREYVYGMAGATLNEEKTLHWDTGEMAFEYDFPEIGKKKLYFPERTQGHGKWMGSVPASYVEARDRLIGAKKAIIVGSRKDRLCLSKLYPHVASTQNESNSAFTGEFLRFLNEQVEQVYMLYDNDEAGRKNSLRIAEEYGYQQLILPDALPGKDIGEITYNGGLYGLTEFLYQQHFI